MISVIKKKKGSAFTQHHFQKCAHCNTSSFGYSQEIRNPIPKDILTGHLWYAKESSEVKYINLYVQAFSERSGHSAVYVAVWTSCLTSGDSSLP